MKSILITCLILILSHQVIAQDDSSSIKPDPLSIGDKIEIHSTILDEDRLLNIYLPYGYSKDSSKTYPVIYLLDGSMDEDFIHIAGLVQFGSFSWINMLPESIVVGIANVDRKRDFTFPTNHKKDKKNFPTSGHSESFIKFIEKEVQPYVEKNYNTTFPKTIIGQSLGGLLATEILVKKPDLFDDYIIVSPSLWWDDESLLNFKPIPYTSKKSIFIAVGKEGYGMEEKAEQLFDQLKSIKKENTKINFKYFEEHDHGDVLHQAIYSAFQELYEKNRKSPLRKLKLIQT